MAKMAETYNSAMLRLKMGVFLFRLPKTIIFYRYTMGVRGKPFNTLTE